MARGDGTDRLSARNANIADKDTEKIQGHNEREKESYSNEDIIKERSYLNVYYKKPSGDYSEVFEQMLADGIISTRGIKADAVKLGELIFDVNTAYFYNHGGYEYAKQFFEDSYRAAIQITGGEQYIISAVMHADERNAAMSEKLGEDVFHYHLHVVYVPVVEKQILWSKRCKDKSLVGTVKETIMQVSHSKKWDSKPVTGEDGKPLLRKDGKPVLRKSYSVLQDDYYEYMKNAGYRDVERGEKGSDEEHLTVTQFKVKKEQERLSELEHQNELQEQKAEELQTELSAVEKKKVRIEEIEKIQPRKIPLTGKVTLAEEEYNALVIAAEKYVTYELRDRELQRQVDQLKKELGKKDSLIDKLKGIIERLTSKITKLERKDKEKDSVFDQLEYGRLRAENENLKKENRGLRGLLASHGILFGKRMDERNIG